MLNLLKNIVKIILYSRVDLSKIIKKAAFIPKIKSSSQTVDELINSNKSVCRFGDGEYSIMKGKDIPFQRHSIELEKKLKKVCVSNNADTLIGISYFYWNFQDFQFYRVIELFRKMYMSKNLDGILSLLDKNKQYRDASFTQIYMTIKNYKFEKHFQKVQRLWADQDIAIICGKSIFDKIDYNIFDRAKSIDYLYAPSKNAFESYEKILLEAKKIPKDKTIFIILGATATVLAYDLADCGYRAIDIGHIAKDYDCFVKGIKPNEKSITSFFKAD